MTVGVGDVIRIVAEWDIPDGTIAQLVWHYLGASGSTATEAQVIASAVQALQDAWPQIQDHISDVVIAVDITAFLWDFVLHQFDGIGQQNFNDADGTSVNEMTPHGAAGLIKMFTVAARRQARKYIMGLDETSVEDGTIVPAVLSDLALFAADLDDPVTTGNLVMNFGTFNTLAASPLFETFSVSSQSVQAEGIIAYQRRRRPGTGI